MKPLSPSGCSLFLAAAVLAVPAPTDACAPAPMRDVVVEVASESAIIVWDAATKTEHFIRRAAFNATAHEGAQVEDFGFLVPTPSQPVLAEADDRAFSDLEKLTAPREERVARPSAGCAMGCGAMAPPGEAKVAAGHVDVLDERHVAGYDATVLKATDVEALNGWLKDHRYEARPALMRWLKPYVENGWVVTAFKIARAPNAPAGSAVGTSAVRMSFRAAAPFFPYSEPDDLRAARTSRLLRVYFLGDRKMTGTLGSGLDWASGQVVWAKPLHAEVLRAITPHLSVPDFKIDDNTWLTEFEDRSSPRSGDWDVTFGPHREQTPVERPTRFIYARRADPAGRVGFGVLVAGVLGVYLLQRRLVVSRQRRSRYIA
jgi:hypothetical protein